MFGTVDSWGAYMFAGNGTPQLRREGARGWQGVVLKEDVKQAFEAIEAYSNSEEFLKINDDNRMEALEDWINSRAKAVEKRLQPINQIEEYCKARALHKIDRNAQLKKAREEFFIRKAAEMKQPMTRAELELVPAYQRSINIPKEPNQKAWILLEKKLLEVRQEVRELIEYEDRAQRQPMIKKYSTFQAKGSEIQPYIEDLAQRAYEAVYQRLHQVSMDETDVTLAVLRSVYDIYYSLPHERRPRTLLPYQTFNSHTHTLSLEDICTVYGFLERAHFPRPHGQGRHPDLFNCPGCCREDVKKRYLPKDLFIHIRTAHAKGVGDFVSFRRMGPFENGVNFLFLVPWPRNLPLLPSRTRSKDGRWNADGEPVEIKGKKRAME